MSKITDALKKVRAEALTNRPTRGEKRLVANGDHGESKKPRTVLPFSPVRIETNTDILNANRVINIDTSREIISSYKMLRTRLLHVMRPNKWQVLAVTSALPGDGKTLTAINLAIVLAREGNQNIFLIDFDLRNPAIYDYFGIEDEKRSIDRFYTENASVTELLLSTEQSGLFFLGNSGSGIENSSELISSERTDRLVSELKSVDPDGIFIFDLPPVLPADDVFAFAPQLDAALIVISEGHTTRESVVKTFNLLRETDIEVAGILLNDTSEGNIDSYY